LIGSIGPQITNIYHLDLSENGFSDEGITAIAEGFFHNQSVSYLNLDRNWSREPRTKPRANAVNSLIQLIGSNHIPLEGKLFDTLFCRYNQTNTRSSLAHCWWQ
jgi:hypothetical protein